MVIGAYRVDPDRFCIFDLLNGGNPRINRDHQGNSWIYNAMLMRWALMPSMANGLSTTHYYYPKSDSWTDANGMKVDAPSKVNVGAKSSTKSKSSGSVFGKTRRSSGVHS